MEFRGFASATGPCIVMFGDAILDPRNDLANHSPDGFRWGYCGSGPAQLALAMCARVAGEERAMLVYQAFKQKVVAKIPANQDWVICEHEVMRHIKAIEGAFK